MQRLDDVTGERLQPVPPLSARERELRLLALIEIVNAQTAQVNFLTGAAQALAIRVQALETALGDAHAALGVQAVSLEAFRHGQTRWERLRWLMRGR